MSVLSSVFVGLIAFNALIFISLVFFRRDRPEARARLFRWVLHTKPGPPSISPALTHANLSVRRGTVWPIDPPRL